MSAVPTHTGTGLRERKKRETRARIIESALDLFSDQGFARTTIPEVAAAADVSPRTISSYFPVKEDLLFDVATETFDRLEAEVARRAPTENFAAALRRWLVAELPRWEHDLPLRARRRAIVAAEPHLRDYSQRYIARGEQIVATAIAQDLGCAPDDIEARMAAAATIAIFAEFEPGPGACSAATSYSAENALGLLDRALRFVEGGISALQNH